MNKSSWIPISISLIFIALGAIMAFTDLFHPIIVFIHSKNITSLQVEACIFGAIIGFYLMFERKPANSVEFKADDNFNRRNTLSISESRSSLT